MTIEKAKIRCTEDDIALSYAERLQCHALAAKARFANPRKVRKIQLDRGLSQEEMKREDALKDTNLLKHNFFYQQILAEKRMLKLIENFILQKTDEIHLVHGQTAIQTEYVRQTYCKIPYFGPSPDPRLPIQWELQRLRPYKTSNLQTTKNFTSPILLPNNILTSALDGPMLVNAAILADPDIRSVLAAGLRLGAKAYRRAEEHIKSETEPLHDFFRKPPPCDDPCAH